MPVATMSCELGVERGPDWLFVRLGNFDPESFAAGRLAERVWSLLEQHLTSRVVLEMADVELLSSELIAQLMLLCRKVHRHGGIIRLSGLSENNQIALQACSLLDRLQVFRDRYEAVMGCPALHVQTAVRPR